MKRIVKRLVKPTARAPRGSAFAAPSSRAVSAALAALAVAVVAASVAAGCARDAATTPAHASWRDDCAALSRPAPLGMDAAREALGLAERRHELRLREAAEPGWFLRSVEAAVAPSLAPEGAAPRARPCLSELASMGEQVFEHEFSFADGLGGGDAARARRSPFRRVHEGAFGAPETVSCASCHWVGGPAGAGAETDNAFLGGDGDRPGSGDARNPQALVALGVVEALAAEMSRDLAAARVALVKAASEAGEAREARLSSKGVDFGVLRVSRAGEVDASGVEGVDADLVVKPFGWKGTSATVAAFVTEALQVHHGMQNDALVAAGPGDASGRGSDPRDPDADGVRGEFGRGAMAALGVHLALLELPIVEPLVHDGRLGAAARDLPPPTPTSFVGDFARGRQVFHASGCASCHRPALVLHDPVLRLDGLPPVDLSRHLREPGLRYDEALGGWPVWLFSDLRRHDMGRDNVARHEQHGVDRRLYLTPRLWGVADSAPYLHDGRAPSFDYAIAGHGGEGRAARAAFAALPDADKGALRVYLMSMRRAPRVTVP